MEELSSFVGYHGTNYKNVVSIQAQNFHISRKQYEWLGYGAYFYIDGISDPIKSARDWVIAQSYGGAGQPLRYNKCAILQATINSTEVLDLRNDEDLIQFNRVRKRILFREQKKFRIGGDDEHDRKLVNFVQEVFGFEVIICNLYIQTVIQRLRGIQSRIPNTTVLCVTKVAVIDKDSIEEIENMEIK